jgi:hypothetical protein
MPHRGVADELSSQYVQSQVEPGQQDHREHMAQAFAYGSQAIDDPEIREIYVQMALENKNNENRPRDMAVSDYYHNHTNLLGDKFQWDVTLYRWKVKNRKERRQKKRR